MPLNDRGISDYIKVANVHGYHLEHLCGLRKSSSERQKVANNYRTPAYQLHFRFPEKMLSDTRTGILGSIAGPCDFLPARSDCPTNFKKSATVQYTIY